MCKSGRGRRILGEEVDDDEGDGDRGDRIGDESALKEEGDIGSYELRKGDGMVEYRCEVEEVALNI